MRQDRPIIEGNSYTLVDMKLIKKNLSTDR